MVRLPATLMIPALFALAAASGCVSSGTKPVKVEKLNEALKEALPSSSALATPLTTTLKGQPATQFVTAWQTKLGQLPDPSKNGAIFPGIVGQVFLYTDKFLPANIAGSLTIVATDATDRPQGQPAKQPNVWHFDADTLKKMTVMDERFGKCLAVFLPWPEEWKDVNRLLIQAAYDQPGTFRLFAPQSTVTLDFFTNGSQVSMSQAKFTANQMAVPDPKVLMQQANAARSVQPAAPKTTFPATGVPPLGSNPIQQAGFQQPAAPQQNWPNGLPAGFQAPAQQQAGSGMGIPAIGVTPAGGIPMPATPAAGMPPMNGMSMNAPPPPVQPTAGNDFKMTIPRN
ncbi:hypothetical protein [Limnoglobus roseus]|uniref:Uncharacterized protein n=1 Tax=Limnoglobus roseus TaxID=2598579 RepID=A0A5C1AJF5_9BACT|nr:hypothetical protein [Limnoglobus roseus]QEL18805.1 hypothetical protein PX52LOC_05845 [Limnoglobus roseus]